MSLMMAGAFAAFGYLGLIAFLAWLWARLDRWAERRYENLRRPGSRREGDS